MLYEAEEGRVKVVSTDMGYITFGRGKKAFIIIPVLGDGLKTVKGTKYCLQECINYLLKNIKYIFIALIVILIIF